VQRREAAKRGWLREGQQQGPPAGCSAATQSLLVEALALSEEPLASALFEQP
jgi:hypothetical protein